jgi:ubiquinone biosynthesis protein COQ4
MVQVKYIEDPELAYVMQRYRECHDFFHLMCSMPVSHLGETVVKIFEASHMGLPVAFLSSVAGPARLNNVERSALFGVDNLSNWAWRMGKKSKPLSAVRWEECWEKDFAGLRLTLGWDEDPPIKVDYAGRVKVNQAHFKNNGRWPSKVIEKKPKESPT